MGKKVSIIVISVLLVGIIGGASVLYNYLSKNTETDRLSVANDGESDNQDMKTDESVTADKEEDSQKEEYTKAPDFTVYDADGVAHKLTDFEGQPVILNFWASWCGPCKKEMPDFEEAYKKYGNEIQFLIVNMTDGYQETVKSAKKFIEDTGYTFPIYYDTGQEAVKAYGVYSIPTTYFIDEKGYIIAYGQGALDAHSLQTGIDYIYDEK